MTSDPRRRRVAACGTLAAAMLVASCALRQPDASRFYVLAASTPAVPIAAPSLTIGVGPLVMPGYLDSPMLATRVGAEIRYAAVDRWAEPLPKLLARTLGQDLSALLGARVVPYPWYGATALDAVVRLDVTAFDADATGHVTLATCWSVRDPRRQKPCGDDCAVIVQPLEGRGAPAQVTALGRTVDDLAQRLATAIRSCAAR